MEPDHKKCNKSSVMCFKAGNSACTSVKRIRTKLVLTHLMDQKEAKWVEPESGLRNKLPLFINTVLSHIFIN